MRAQVGDVEIEYELLGPEDGQLIAAAQLVSIQGMGHFPLAQERWTTVADGVIAHTQQA